MTRQPSPQEFARPASQLDAVEVEGACDLVIPRRYSTQTEADRRAGLAATLLLHAAIAGAFVLNLGFHPAPKKQATSDIHFITLGESIPAGDPNGDSAPPKPVPQAKVEPTPKPPADQPVEDPTKDIPPAKLPSKVTEPLDQLEAAEAQAANAQLAEVQGTGTLAIGAKTHGEGAGLDGDLMAAIGQAIATQISACWDAPRTNLPDNLVITMTASFGTDGELVGSPTVSRLVNDQPQQVIWPNAYERAAMEAVQRCAPLKLPSQYYAYWQMVDVQIFSSQLPDTLEVDDPTQAAPNQPAR